MIVEQFDLKQLLNHFSDVGEKRFTVTLDLKALENMMKPIRNGDEELSFNHINNIKKDWAFLKWWKMPEMSADELSDLRGLFLNIQPKDKEAITKLYEVFKNIEIVSCILRFTYPEFYGIFSPPVENLLSIRGKFQIEKYLNYLSDLEELKEKYKFERIADVDMALWTLANILSSSKLRYNPLYYEIYEQYHRTPNILKMIMARNSLEQIWEEKPPYLELAALILETDPGVAGILAGKALELFVKQRCKKYKIKSKLSTKKGPEYRKIAALSEELALRKDISEADCEDIKRMWIIRNDSVHESNAFKDHEDLTQMKEKISKMIKEITALENRTN